MSKVVDILEGIDKKIDDQKGQIEIMLDDALQDVQGLSAFDIAKINGFEGTEVEWLESLRGEQGVDSNTGQLLETMPDTENGIIISNSTVVATVCTALNNFNIPTNGYIVTNLINSGINVTIRRNGLIVHGQGASGWDGQSGLFKVAVGDIIQATGTGNTAAITAANTVLTGSLATAMFFPIKYFNVEAGPLGAQGFTGATGPAGSTPILEAGSFSLGDINSFTFTGTTENPILNLQIDKESIRGPQGIDSAAGQIVRTRPTTDGAIVISNSGIVGTIATELQNFAITSNGYIAIAVDGSASVSRWINIRRNGITVCYIGGGGWDGNNALFDVIPGDVITVLGTGTYTVSANTSPLAGVVASVVFLPMTFVDID